MDDALSSYDESLQALEKQRESLELVMKRMGAEWEERYGFNLTIYLYIVTQIFVLDTVALGLAGWEISCQMYPIAINKTVWSTQHHHLLLPILHRILLHRYYSRIRVYHYFT